MNDIKKVVLTYGTFDLFHIGHLNLLKHLKSLGTYLIVGVSTDEFNTIKGKKTVIPYTQRAELVAAVRYVDQVIPESNWEQKAHDINTYQVDIFGMGDDWVSQFDHLANLCEVVYLPRTKNISTTELKDIVHQEITTELLEIHQATYRLERLVKGILNKNK
jgi:glycerol-3-phosphate cytidylyltransferase